MNYSAPEVAPATIGVGDNRPRHIQHPARCQRTATCPWRTAINVQKGQGEQYPHRGCHMSRSAAPAGTHTQGIHGRHGAQEADCHLRQERICLAILCSSLAFSLWVSTIKNLGVAKSSIFSALIPVAAALIAWILGHELLNSRQWAGIAVSSFGVILSQYTKKKS